MTVKWKVTVVVTLMDTLTVTSPVMLPFTVISTDTLAITCILAVVMTDRVTVTWTVTVAAAATDMLDMLSFTVI